MVANVKVIRRRKNIVLLKDIVDSDETKIGGMVIFNNIFLPKGSNWL